MDTVGIIINHQINDALVKNIKRSVFLQPTREPLGIKRRTKVANI